MQEDQFWKKFISASFDLRGVFWNYEKCVRFLEKAISGKIVADFQIFKTSITRQKRTSFVPPNILNKFLSRNPNLTKRCEVNKFNLVSLL